jgi:hypothetical protein
MGVSWARVGLLVLVLAIALPAATVFAQKGGEAGPVPERNTTCWPCHVPWAPPLKTFFNILPPPEAGGPVGETFDYVVQIQGAWTPPGDGPYITYYETTLDLTGAPSLSFFSDTPETHDTLTGSIPANPTSPNTPSSSFVVEEVPTGSTDLTVTLVPDDENSATGPKLTLNLYAGSSAPQGTPSKTATATTRGGTVTITLAKDDFKGLGYGNWTAEAVNTPLPAAPPTNPADLLGVPSLQDVSYSVKFDIATKDTGERLQVLPVRERVAKGAGALVRFHLSAASEPAAGEVVHVSVNTTEYYKHNPSSSPDDYANVTKAFSSDIPVVLDGPRVVVRTEGGTSTIVGGAVQNGATLDTMSESIGYGTAFLLISSIWTGGMFGKASRRQLNGVFGTAKRRVAFHNFLSYGLMLFAAVHTTLFIIEAAYYWTLGLIWGGLALISMLLLGATGAWQVWMIRKWNYGVWRWSHYGLALAAIVFTLVHMGLDGVHFGFIQEPLGWDDPLDPRDLEWLRPFGLGLLH